MVPKTERIWKIKRQMAADPEIRKLMIRGRWDEILLDLDGDGKADVCLSSDHSFGKINTLSFDLSGNGQFNLYLHDADGNGIPDSVFWVDDDSKEPVLVASGSEVERGLIALAAQLEAMLDAEECVTRDLGVTLGELSAFLDANAIVILAESQKQKAPSDLERVCLFLDGVGTYYLATADGDQPRVRPFGTVLLYEDKLYIQTGKKKDVSKQLAKNPKAEICAFADGKWLRISGELVEDDRREAKAAMLDKYPYLKGMYSADDDNTQVLYFQNATAVFSAFGAAPETVQF